MVKVGNNDPCICGAKDADGNPIKYKKCCRDIHKKALSVIDACQALIKVKYLEVLKSRGLTKAQLHREIKDHICTYYLNGVKALVVDYTGLPMKLNTKEDILKVSEVDINTIPMEQH